MKKIVTFFKPSKIEAVKECLSELGYEDARYSYCKGPTVKEIVWQGKRYEVELLPKARMEVVVDDSDVEDVVNRITQLVRTRPEGSKLGEEAEYALRLKGEDIGHPATTGGRWVRMTPAHEAAPHHEELAVVEIRA